MKYDIIGKTVPAVEVTLNRGESMYTQRGGLAWQTDGIKMSTNAKGGIMKSLGRVFTGESIFMSTYMAEKDEAKVAFAITVPGNIIPLDLTKSTSGFIIQKGSFLAAESNIDLKMHFTKRLSSGIFGGEGFILQKVQGNGMVFLEVDGDAIVKDLEPGETIKVDTGNIVGFQPSVSYEIEMVKGLGNIVFGGEGLFLTKLVGPGKVILQTQNFSDFAGRIIGMIPTNRN